MCLAQGGMGGEGVSGLDLGCGGIGGEWIGGLDQGLGGWCLCEFGFSVLMAGPGIYIIMLGVYGITAPLRLRCTQSVPVFNPVSPTFLRINSP